MVTILPSHIPTPRQTSDKLTAALTLRFELKGQLRFPALLDFVDDAKMIQTVLANEGTHTLTIMAMLYYNRHQSINRGLFFQKHKVRKALNEPLATSENMV